MEISRWQIWLLRISALAMAGLAVLPMDFNMFATAIFALLGLLWVLQRRSTPFQFSKIGKIAIALAVVCLGWGSLAIASSPQVNVSLEYMCHLLALSLGGLVIGLQMEAPWRKKLVLVAGIALSATLIYSISRISGYNKASSPPFFQDTNFLSAAAVLLLPLLGALGWSDRRKWTGWVAWGMFILFLVSIVLFRSRGAWLSLIAAGLVFPSFLLPSQKWRIGWLIGVLLLSVGYFGFRVTRPSGAPTTRDAFGQLKSIGELNNDFSNRERLMRWECAWRMAKRKPLFGEGPGRYPQVFKNYLRSADEVDRISWWFGWRFGAHSDSLNLLGETGFVGFFAFVGMLLAVIAIALGRILKINPGLAPPYPAGFSIDAGVMLGFFSWVVHGCFNDLLSSSFLIVWAFWMIGQILTMGNRHMPELDAR